MATEGSGSLNIHIDVDSLRELVDVANRRVSAFIRFGSDGLDEWDGGDFNLTASVGYRFWPAEIAVEDRQAAREEYRAWLVGSCLRELDAIYSLFLDRLWRSLELIELHGTRVRADQTLDTKFARKTNVAAKQHIVAAKLKTRDHFEELNSLGLARNALAHHTGLVRSPVDCNNPLRDALTIKWLAFEMLVSREGEERVVTELPFDTHSVPGSGPLEVGVRYTPRQLSVPAGSQIRFSNPQIAELCMFYKMLSEIAIDAFLSLLKDRGLFKPSIAS